MDYATKFTDKEIEDYKKQIGDLQHSSAGHVDKLSGLLNGLYKTVLEEPKIEDVYYTIKDNISLYYIIFKHDDLKLLLEVMQKMEKFSVEEYKTATEPFWNKFSESKIPVLGIFVEFARIISLKLKTEFIF
jgi:hypothetical protein